MSEKDFLSQFSGENMKPDSFKEEVRTPVVKKKKPINKGLVIGLLALLAVLGVAGYFLFLAPKIEMQDFVYDTKTEAIAWIKQQGIESSGIIFKDEYDFEYDEGIILSQDVKPGTKLKSDAKITFTVSKGADPDESISVPDLMSMDKEDIREWIDENKLSKTKISTAYNDNVEDGKVISYQFSGCDEDSFTRSSNLKINVSKGPAPAGNVTMEDFVKRSYEEAEAWAKSKKVGIIKTESYSDKYAEGTIISQTIAAGKPIKEGDSFGVVVSMGKSVSLIDLVGMTSGDAMHWCSKNGLELRYTEQYDSIESKGKVIYQITPVGKTLKSGDEVEAIVSLGNVEYPGFNTLRELKDWIEEVNTKGAGLVLKNVEYDFSDEVEAGDFISVSRIYTDAPVYVTISRGRNIWLNRINNDIDFNDLLDVSKNDEETVRKFFENTGINYYVDYKSDPSVPANHLIRMSRSDGELLTYDTYIPQDVEVVLEISTGN